MSKEIGLPTSTKLTSGFPDLHKWVSKVLLIMKCVTTGHVLRSGKNMNKIPLSGKITEFEEIRKFYFGTPWYFV